MSESTIWDWALMFAVIMAVVLIVISAYNGDFLWTAIFVILIIAIIGMYIIIRRSVDEMEV